MSIHSKILVHWPGRDIYEAEGNDKARQYVERLRDDLEHGLFAKRTTEAAIRCVKVKDLVRICFTEIRLSQTQTHADRYGGLGIGFAREFVMDRGGRPVIYIPYHASPNGSLLEDSIRHFWRNRIKEDKAARRAITSILSYVKRMCDPGSEQCDARRECEAVGKKCDVMEYCLYEGDCFYEEMEWRLVYGDDGNHFVSGNEDGVYRVKFEPRDVKLIVLPDTKTKQLALEDDDIRKRFSDHTPIIVTLDECDSF